MSNSTQSRGARLVSATSARSDPEPSIYAKNWAVVIGIDDYGGEHPQLANARNDAAGMARLLQSFYGFQQIMTLFDGEASRDAILSLLRDQLPQQVGEEDCLIIFFAGHGTTRVSDNGFKRGYIIPQNGEAGKYSTYIDMEEIRDACNWIPAKHILIILDCCFSGIAAVTSRSTPTTSPTVMNDAYLKRITERQARQVLTAGASDEVVADSGSRPGHSAFTGAILAGLEGYADQNEDGIITASDLASFVKPLVTRETVTARSAGQTPFFNYLAGSDQGDIVFLRPDIPLRVEKAIPGPIPAVSHRSPFWLVVLVLMSVVIAFLGWRTFFGGTAAPTPDATVAYQAIVTTITAQSHATAQSEQATTEAELATSAAAAALPTPTHSPNPIVDIAAATAVTSPVTARPALIPTDTPTLAPIPSATPDLEATRVVVQATNDAIAQATRQIEMTAEEARVAAAATATTTHITNNSPISVAGATTLENLTGAMIEQYRANGYLGVIQADYVGTRGGFVDYFCQAERLTDIVLVTGENREQDPEIVNQCNSVGRVPIGFKVAQGKVDIDNPDERYEPVYLYTTVEILQSKPQVAAFLRYYLANVNEVLTQFPDLYAQVGFDTLQNELSRLSELIQT